MQLDKKGLHDEINIAVINQNGLSFYMKNNIQEEIKIKK